MERYAVFAIVLLSLAAMLILVPSEMTGFFVGDLYAQVGQSNSSDNSSSGGSSSTGSSGGGGGGGGSALPARASQLVIEEEIFAATVTQGGRMTFNITLHNPSTSAIKAKISIEGLENITFLRQDEINVPPLSSITLPIEVITFDDTPSRVYAGKIVITVGAARKEAGVVLNVRKPFALFDITLSIPEAYKKIFAGGTIQIVTHLENIGYAGRQLDVELEVFMQDFDNNLVQEARKKTVAVGPSASTIDKITVPASTPAGKYLIVARATYPTGDVRETVEAFESLDVASRPAPWMMVIVVILGLAVLAVATAVIKSYREHQKILKGFRPSKG